MMMTFVVAIHLLIPVFVGAAAAAMTECRSRPHAMRVGALAGLLAGVLFWFQALFLLGIPMGALGALAVDFLIRPNGRGTFRPPHASKPTSG